MTTLNHRLNRRSRDTDNLLFKGGEVAATKVGALPKSKLKEWLSLLSNHLVNPAPEG